MVAWNVFVLFFCGGEAILAPPCDKSPESTRDSDHKIDILGICIV